MRCISASSKVPACDNAVGNTVVPIAMCPCGHSSAISIGMPSRVFSTAYFCILFNASAASRGFKPLARVLRVHGSARSTAQSDPNGCCAMRSLKSCDTSTLSPTRSYIGHPSGQSSCPTFSLRVICSSKMSTRSSTGRLASLYRRSIDDFFGDAACAIAAEVITASAINSSISLFIFIR